MKIKVNGQDYQMTGDPVSLASLVHKLGGLQEGMAVAYNLEVVPQQDLPKIVLKEGDVLEIIQAVGGG